MTVSSTSNRVVYSGNASTTDFPFAFKVQSAADLVVVYTDATGTDFMLSPAQYSATGFGLDAGGAVVYPVGGAPIATGTRLTIYRDVAVTQPAAISNQGAMWPSVIEAALDRATYILQKVADSVSRALAVSPTDSGTLSPLPNATQRANSVLGFDSDGQPYAAQIGAGLGVASSWLVANFLPAASQAAARTALDVPSSAGVTGEIAAATAALVGIAPIGGSILYAGRLGLPAGWLLENGGEYGTADYPDLSSIMVRHAAVSISIASPCVVGWASHGLWDGDPFKATTTGDLPDGLVAGATYYVKAVNANSFRLSATPGGSNIDTSGSQSGVHTGISAAHGCRDDLSHFNVPDSRGVAVVGHDAMGGAAAGRLTVAGSGFAGASLGYIGGEQAHALGSDENGPHTHTALQTGSTTPSTGGGAVVGTAAGGATGSSGLGTPHNNVQPSSVRVWIIRAL